MLVVSNVKLSENIKVSSKVGLKLILILYLISTVILYNNFFGIAASSRWPLIVLTLFFGPFAISQKCNKKLFVRFSLWYFISGFLFIEIIHLALGSNELFGIFTLLSIMLFMVLTKEYSKRYLIEAIILVSILYLLFFYPLAYANDMVGVQAYGRGRFVTQYFPQLAPFIINGHYKSGRGVIGLIGGVLAILSLIRIRYLGFTTYHLVMLFIGCMGVILSNARGVIFSLIAISLLILLPMPTKFRVRLFFFMPFGVVILTPILLVIILGSLNSGGILSEILSLVSREGISDISRFLVWDESIRLITSSLPRILVGYGGIGSALVLKSAFAAKYVDIEQLDSAHNLFLQLLLDGGIILLLLFVGYLYRIFVFGWKYSRYIAVVDLDVISVFVFLVLCSMTGSFINVNRVNEAMFLLMIVLIALNKQMDEVI